jgi:uncharacterized protein (TIGR03086 family)
MTDLRPLHRRALADARGYVDRVDAAALGRPTPCAGWDLDALLAHIVGQHHGFAAAVCDGDAPVSAYGPRAVRPDRIAADWQDSADLLTAAFAGTGLDRPVRLVEISAELRFPAGTAIGFQLLDTVIHTWDVASALGVPYGPEPELAAATLALARQVPAGDGRLAPGAAFAPVLTPAADDDWTEALALTGRAG